LLILYGGGGLFAISFLDSSFLSFPLLNDLLLIHLCSRRPQLSPVYVTLGSLGSVLGACTIYALARGGGGYLWRRYSPNKLDRVRRWLARNDFAAVLVAALLPPPAPFKVFLVAAGMLRVNAIRFAGALVVGRGVRFTAEGLLAARYGAAAEAYLKHHLAWASLVAAVAVAGIALLSRTLLRGAAQRQSSEPSWRTHS